MKKEIIKTDNAPAAIGPYSQAIKIGDLIYTSGQIPINPKTGELISSDIKEQTKQVLENIKAILETAGSSLDKIIKTTLFISNMDEFAMINEVYSSYFGENPPARSTVQVASLPKNAGIEIEAIAHI